MASTSICHICIGFQICTKIPINIDPLPVQPSVQPSIYPFFLKRCLHILSKVFRSIAKQHILEVGESDVDPQEFKGVIRTSQVSEFKPYNKHQIFRFFDHLYNYCSQ